jgi:galactokinase
MGMDPMAYLRARHVISEIARTLDFAAAMEKHDYVAAGKRMYESHASLRDDYAVSCPELDSLVEIARGVPGVFGARMTGGGFGGCIVALTKSSAVAALTKQLETEYPLRHGKQPTIFATTATQGAHVVK